MWKKWKNAIAEKIDIKITGYISAAMFGIAAVALLYVIGLSAGAAGALPLWAAYAGFGIMVFCWLAILLSKWGQRQTGRRLKINKIAVWLNGGLIGVMGLIYVLGIVLSV